MEQVNLFSIPIYRFPFADHTSFKAQAMPFLYDEELYSRNSVGPTGLQFTHPNLHRESVFAGFREFVQANLETVMTLWGYQPQIQMTGMWATRHFDRVGHHRHTHGNSFLTGVYYLSGTNSNAGTTFYNPNRSHNQIIPARIPETPQRLQHTHTESFQEGTLVIFPAWLEHNTATNDISRTNSVRYILSFNTMPLGKTTNDPFDRFNYLDASDAEMINYNSERIR